MNRHELRERIIQWLTAEYGFTRAGAERYVGTPEDVEATFEIAELEHLWSLPSA